MRPSLTVSVRSALLAVPLSASVLLAQEAPANVTVGWVQNSVTVSWTIPRNRAVQFRVMRGTDPTSLSQNLTTTLLPPDATSFVDPSAAAGAAYAYQVVAVYSGKLELPSTPVQYLVPSGPVVYRAAGKTLMGPAASKIANPATLTGEAYIVACGGGQGYTPAWCTPNVRLDWSLVPGASYYMVWGPGIPSTGVQVVPMLMADGSTGPGRYVATSGFPWGASTWTVAAFFLPGPVSTDPSLYAKVVVNNPVPWWLHD